jgi:hypothetical protein
MLYSATIFSLKMTVLIICGVLFVVIFITKKHHQFILLLHDTYRIFQFMYLRRKRANMAVQVDVSDPSCIKHYVF